MATPSLDSPRWRTVVDEHRVALAAYLDTAARLTPEAWNRPWGPGKWTPGEVTEHLLLVCEAFLSEVETGRGMQLKLTPWRRRLGRWFLLPHILFHRSFPPRAPAPRETRPDAPRADRDGMLEALRGLGERVEEALGRAHLAGGGVTHPYFGLVDAVRALRLGAVHLEHHRRQIERAAAAPVAV